MHRLLIIEDEVKTAESIRQGLSENDFAVEVANDGDTGLRLALDERYDVIVTDRLLPYRDGLEICKELRRQKVITPILMLTALGAVDDKVEGLDAGADDYLAKPFEFRELLARVRALIKRTHYLEGKERILNVGSLSLGLDTKKVFREGRAIELTAKEFALLEFLMRNKDRVVSKSEIAERVWGIRFDTGTNVVEVYVNYLRKKVDRDFQHKLIHTVIGMGYVIRD